MTYILRTNYPDSPSDILYCGSNLENVLYMLCGHCCSSGANWKIEKWENEKLMETFSP